MLENLKLGPSYEGFLFLAESIRNPPTLRPHHHAELELNLVADGTISYVAHGQRYTFKKGTLLWLFPSQEHQLVDRTADAAYYVAVFKPDFIKRACRGQRYAELKRKKPSQKGVLHTALSPRDFDRLRREMEAIIADGLDPDLLNREAGFGLSADFSFQHNDPDWLNAGLRYLLLLCWRLQQNCGGYSGQANLHPVVRRALDCINEDNTLDLHGLSRLCGASEAHLSRTFHQQIGVTLSRYRNSLRLSQFWENYRDPNRQNMTDAALAAGFGSYAQFYRVFCEAYGKSPRDMHSR
jgi:AraC-like DNA-binding protein